MSIDGKGPYMIARILQAEKVQCLSYYLAQKGVGQRQNKDFDNPYRWWGTAVMHIIGRKEYMGHMVNFKTFKKSYKDKHHKPNPEDKHLVL